MNKVVIIGHLGSDAEVKQGKEKAYVKFSVCSTEAFTNSHGEKKEIKTWFNCVSFNGDKLVPYLRKGVQVYIEGKPSVSAWIDRDQKAQGSLDVVIREIKLLSAAKKPEGENHTGGDDLPI
jgi:single-strand DNA-binding protein